VNQKTKKKTKIIKNKNKNRVYWVFARNTLRRKGDQSAFLSAARQIRPNTQNDHSGSESSKQDFFSRSKTG